MIPIVLTATVAPQVSSYSVHNDPDKRKKEYLEAIAFYRRFSKVYFLENSGYPVRDDADFSREDAGLVYRSYEKPADKNRNKGSLEFEMLDRFVRDELKEDGFIKITGRYLYGNFRELFDFTVEQADRRELLIDAYCRKKSAFTSLFYSSRALYRARFAGAHAEMKDAPGRWAEHVYYERLRGFSGYGFFRPLPMLRMISGADGVSVDYARMPVRNFLKNAQRACHALAGARELLF